jgi:hypothetical protein
MDMSFPRRRESIGHSREACRLPRRGSRNPFARGPRWTPACAGVTRPSRAFFTWTCHSRAVPRHSREACPPRRRGSRNPFACGPRWPPACAGVTRPSRAFFTWTCHSRAVPRHFREACPPRRRGSRNPFACGPRWTPACAGVTMAGDSREAGNLSPAPLAMACRSPSRTNPSIQGSWIR